MRIASINRQAGNDADCRSGSCRTVPALVLNRCAWALLALGLFIYMGLAAPVIAGTKSSGAAAAGAGGPAPAAADPNIAPPARTILRFLTDSDYPPFNYTDEDGTLTGYNIDFARAICAELDVTCDIQPRPWGDLLPSLGRGDADAVIASIAINQRTIGDADFSDRYYFTPARFVGLKTAQPLDVTPIGLESVKVGVVAGSAHEAYLEKFFRDCLITKFESLDAAHEGLKAGKVDLIFVDGISQMFWLNGTGSAGCCEFRGGAYFDDRYFGDGVGIAVHKGDVATKRLLDKAIAALRKNGRFEELFLRYFPMKLF